MRLNTLWNRLLDWLAGLWSRKQEEILPPAPPPPVRRKVDTNAIRTRITTQGWRLLELPIKKNHPDPAQRTIARWKLVASRGNQSIEVGGTTLDEAMKNVGQMLGVVPREG